MDNQIEYVDRYGGNYPTPETVCKGDCEGMGFYPTRTLTDEERAFNPGIKPDDTGCYWPKCLACKGTGKRPEAAAQ